MRSSSNKRLRALLWALALSACGALAVRCGQPAYRCDRAGARCDEGSVCLPEGLCAVRTSDCSTGLRCSVTANRGGICVPPEQVGDAGTGSDAGFDGAASDAGDARPPDDVLAPDAPADVRVPCEGPAPRLLHPLSGARLVSARPGARLLVQGSYPRVRVELSRTRDFAAIMHTVDASAQPAADGDAGASGDGSAPGDAGSSPASTTLALAPVDPLPAGAWFWRARGLCADGTTLAPSEPWTLHVPHVPQGMSAGPRGQLSGAALPAVADFDGDGLADFAVSAPSERAVYVFFGARDARTAPLAVTRLTGPPGGTELFGATLAAGGDLNGDGYGELIIGACNPRGQRDGTVPAHLCPPHFYVLRGGPRAELTATRLAQLSLPSALTEMTQTPAITFELLGDLRGDGTADLAVGSERALGFQSAPVALYEGQLGVVPLQPAPIVLPVPTTHGDVAGFGYSLAYRSSERASNGAPLLYVGSIGRLFTVELRGSGVFEYAPTPLSTMGEFGVPTRPAGDFNADGQGDLAVGNGQLTGLGARLDRVHLLLSTGSAAPRIAVAYTEPGALFTPQRRMSVSGNGDLNGDGYDDLLLGGVEPSPSMMMPPPMTLGVQLVQGTGGALTAPRECLRSGVVRVREGRALAIVGDVDGDGFDDFVVSGQRAPEGDGGAATGYVTLHFGAAELFSRVGTCEPGVPLRPSMDSAPPPDFGTLVR